MTRLAWLGFGILLACGGGGASGQATGESGEGESGTSSSAENSGSSEPSAGEVTTDEDTDSGDDADTGVESPLGIPYCATASESLENIVLPIRAKGDVNGDGHLDLVVGNTSEQVVFVGDGAGAFAAGSGAPAPGGGESLTADVNGDGRADLVRYDLFDEFQDITVHLSDGAGFGDGVEGNFDSLFYHASAHDFDGDGNDDMLVGGQHGNPAQVFRSLGDGSFEEAYQLPPPACYVLSADAADVDGDGDLDVAVTGGCNASLEDPAAAVFIQEQGNFAEGVVYLTDNWDPPFVRFGELDGDGVPDMFVQGWHLEARFSTHRGVGDGTFEERVEQAVSHAGDPTEMWILDADGDGLSDLLQRVQGHVVLHRNTGGAFATCYWGEGDVYVTGDFSDHLGDEIIVDATGTRLSWLVD